MLRFKKEGKLVFSQVSGFLFLSFFSLKVSNLFFLIFYFFNFNKKFSFLLK